MRKLLFIVLSMFVWLFMPGLVCLADTGRSVQLINPKNPAGGIDVGDHVYFGKNLSAVNNFDGRWRVLDARRANNGKEGMFLLSENLITDMNSGAEGVYFDKDGEPNYGQESQNDWQGSNAQDWCKTFHDNCFYEKEQYAVMATRKADDPFVYKASSYECEYKGALEMLKDDRVFFLSAEEAQNKSYGLLSNNDRKASFNGKSSWWWLRSGAAGSKNNLIAGAINKDGGIDYRNIKEESPARPAFNLDWSYILLTTAAEGGKSVRNMGKLTRPADYDKKEWKLTLMDFDHDSFSGFFSKRNGDVVTFSYEGAVTRANNYISALIVNSSGEVTYYGVLKTVSSSEGTVSIDIGGKYERGDMLYVINEEINEDKSTDYSSSLYGTVLKEIVKIPEPVSGLSYTGGKQTGVRPAAAYTLTGNSASAAGHFTAIAALKDPDLYQWSDGSTDPKMIEWSISESSITGVSVSGIQDKTYTGQDITQKPVIQLGKVRLVEGRDYSISYSRNKEPGTATMVITGIGSMKGSIAKTFKILESSDNVISRMTSDEAPKGSSYQLLQLKSAGRTKKSITIRWKRIKGAAKYVIYGNKCGRKNKMKKLKVVSKRKASLKKVGAKKMKKGTYYKFLVVAVDRMGRVLSISKTVHIVTKGGKYGNDKKVITEASGGRVTLKRGARFALDARPIPQSSKHPVQRHRRMKYESSNNKIARVTKKGVIKAMRTGSCRVYAYTQNGVCARINVTVR